MITFYLVAMFSASIKRGCSCDNCLPIIEIKLPGDGTVKAVKVPGMGKIDMWGRTGVDFICYGPDRDHKPEILLLECWNHSLGAFASTDRQKVENAKAHFNRLRSTLFDLL